MTKGAPAEYVLSMPTKRPTGKSKPSQNRWWNRKVSSSINLKTYQFNLTPAGWFFFILMILIMGAAIASGHNLLYLVVCLFFGSFVVMGNVAVMNLQKLEVSREIPEFLHAETPCAIGIRVTNPRQLMDTFALEIRETTGNGKKNFGKVFLPLVETESEATSSYTLNHPHRGWFEFKGLEVMTRFPFGFWERSRLAPQPARALFFPKIFVNWPEADSNLTVEGEFVGTKWGTGDELLNFRDYQAGDPVRWIHWKNTAKTDRLTVALFHHPKNRNVMIWLRTQYAKGADGTFEKHFEESISWAATAACKLLERGVSVGYSDPTIRLAPASGEGQRIRILTHLALVQIAWGGMGDGASSGGPQVLNEDTIRIEATQTGVLIDSGRNRRIYGEAIDG